MIDMIPHGRQYGVMYPRYKEDLCNYLDRKHVFWGMQRDYNNWMISGHKSSTSDQKLHVSIVSKQDTSSRQITRIE